MKKFKKVVAFMLAFSFLFVEAAPAAVYAKGLENDSPAEDVKLEMDDAANYKKQIKNIRDEVNGLKIHRKTDKEMVEEFNSKSLELSDNIDHTAQKFGIADVYDLSSIPQRLILLGRIGRAIRFATTQLRYKVDAAHAEIAEYVFAGLVIAVSPFHTVEDMKTYMAEFEVLKDKLLSYPEMGLNDTANLYVRADLDVKLDKARFMKYNELKNKPTYIIERLDREIADITNGRLRPQATVAEIYQLSDRLDQAVAEAQNSEDTTALPSEVKRLKELKWELQKAIMAGDKRPEAGAAVDRAREEVWKIRPSHIAVTGLIETIESLLY